MLEGGRGIEAGRGDAEVDPRMRNPIEVGPEALAPRVEHAPADTDTTFTWDGKEYTVSQKAAAVGKIIYIDDSENRDGTHWIGLKVAGVSKDQLPKIESLTPHKVALTPAAIRIFASEGSLFLANPKV